MSQATIPHESIPDYWLPQPEYAFGDAERRACDEVWAAARTQGADTPFAYPLVIPKWRFLCYLADQHEVALHGSPNGAISRFEPRQPIDLRDFGAQRAVYAAADGIWPIYFAIVDRVKSPTLNNACIQVERPDGTREAPRYFFSISSAAPARQPYHNGVVYLLPRASFMTEPPIPFGNLRIHSAQLASLEAVTPLAKLAVTPEDFPFLAQMRTHDDARLAEYAAAMQQGLPLPE